MVMISVVFQLVRVSRNAQPKAQPKLRRVVEGANLIRGSNRTPSRFSNRSDPLKLKCEYPALEIEL